MSQTLYQNKLALAVVVAVLLTAAIGIGILFFDANSSQLSTQADTLHDMKNGQVSISLYQTLDCDAHEKIVVSDENDARVLLDSLERKMLGADLDRWSYNIKEYTVFVTDDNTEMTILLAGTPGVITTSKLQDDWYASEMTATHVLGGVFYLYYGISILSDTCFIHASLSVSDNLDRLSGSQYDLTTDEVRVLKKMIPEIEKRYFSIDGHREDGVLHSIIGFYKRSTGTYDPPAEQVLIIKPEGFLHHHNALENV